MRTRDRLSTGLLLCFLGALPAVAQYTTVTGTVTDVNTLPYANAQAKAQLVVAGAPVTGQPTVQITNAAQCQASGFGSAPCQVPFPGTIGPFSLDVNGNLPAGGLQFQDNTKVTPAGTQWLFTVNQSPGTPPPVGTGPQVCTATITISGATQVISSSLNTCPALSKVVANPPTVPAGPSGSIQFDNAGAFGAVPGSSVGAAFTNSTIVTLASNTGNSCCAAMLALSNAATASIPIVIAVGSQAFNVDNNGNLYDVGSFSFGLPTVQTLLFTHTPPTISSGFGTSPSIAHSNGSVVFTINVGTGGTATSGVIALPGASNGWDVKCTDITTMSTTVFITKQTATTSATATIGNFNNAATAAAWAASDILSCTAFAY